MKIGLENSRKHLYDTARRFAKGRSVTTEISMAKLITSEANLQSALSAVQIFGGRGYMKEYGIEKSLRDAVGAPIYSGTNEMQRVRIASMLGLYAAPQSRFTPDFGFGSALTGVSRSNFAVVYGGSSMAGAGCAPGGDRLLLPPTGLRRGCAVRGRDFIQAS